MNSDRWQQVKEIFYAAQEREISERAAFLSEVCADEELKREVESLLLSFNKSDSFIEHSPLEDELFENKEESLIGEKIGYYKILEEIGCGGMGAVFLAERADGEFEQKVALKLVRHGINSTEMRRRFRQERQILASLEHPNIARLLDGGTTKDGLPYLVMEYVEGEPILEFCDSERFPIEKRLRLFREVCAAVAHAHRNLVVHRDLKPSNILVTKEGTPKLLDFGIAKLLETDENQTQTGLRPFTPDYASPEQLLGEKITTASDIYSLGILIYELLTGSKPFSSVGNSLEKKINAVLNSEPESLSTVFQRVNITKNNDSSLEKISAARAISPDKLRSSLRSDLETITQTALRKEPEKRYLSAEDLSEDVRRYLENLPLKARPVTFFYRAGKFIHRNKLAVAAGILLVLSLFGGVMATLWQARITRSEHDRALVAQAKAERINKFLQETLGAADPTKEGREVKMVDILDKAVRRAETEFAAQPEVLADVRRTIGRTFYNLEVYDKAESLLRSALETYREVYGEESPVTATCQRDLAMVFLYQDKPAEALPLLLAAVDLQRRRMPDDKREFAETLLSLGSAFYYAGDEQSKQKARQIYSEALEYSRQNLESDDPLLASALNELANTGDTETAINLYRQSIEILRRLPEQKMDLATTLSNLGLSLSLVGKYSEAESPLRESLTLRREIFGSDSPQSAISLAHLSRALCGKGDFAEAEALAREAVQIQEKKLPAGHRNFYSSFTALGRALTKNGKPSEAEKYLRAAHSWMLKRFGAEDERVAETESILGECLAVQKRYREAESFLVRSYEVLKTRLGEKDTVTLEALQRLNDFRTANEKNGF